MSHQARGVPPVRQLDPALDFLRLLWQIEHGLERTSKRMGATLGITGPQRLVLRVVGQFPGLSAGELAEIVHLHPSTITGVLQRLIRKDLLERQPDPLDSRRVRLRVRPRGRRFADASPGTVEFAVARGLARVPARQIRNALTVLSIVAAALSSDA